MESCNVCFRVLSNLPIVFLTEIDLQRVAPDFVVNENTFLNHLLFILSKYERKSSFHVCFEGQGTLVHVCDYCLYCCSMKTFFNEDGTPGPFQIDALASGSGSIITTLPMCSIEAEADAVVENIPMSTINAKSEDYVPPKVVPPVGSFNRRDWQTHLQLNGTENNMYAEFLKYKEFIRDLSKSVDPRCYKSAILSSKKAFELAQKIAGPRLPGQVVHDCTHNLIKRSAERASDHAHGTLLYQDLSDITGALNNVYTQHLVEVFTRQNMGISTVDLMKSLVQLYFSYFSFPAWRVAFFILWKHTETESEKKKICNLLLKRVPYNSYTKVIYRLLYKEINFLSLFNHEEMCAKVVHLRKMEIYKYNYETLQRAVDKEELIPVQIKKKTRKFFRSPRDYSPIFKQVCKEVQPVWEC